jgi:hypothetical protein
MVSSGVDQTVLSNNKVSFRFKALGNRYLQHSYFLNVIRWYELIVYPTYIVVVSYQTQHSQHSVSALLLLACQVYTTNCLHKCNSVLTTCKTICLAYAVFCVLSVLEVLYSATLQQAMSGLQSQAQPSVLHSLHCVASL